MNYRPREQRNKTTVKLQNHRNENSGTLELEIQGTREWWNHRTRDSENFGTKELEAIN